MKHYFVDTNVVIDLLANREGYAESAAYLFDAAERKEIHLSVCALSYANIYYILRKRIGNKNAIAALSDLSEYVSILPVNESIIQQALHSDFSDFEDAIQYYAASQDSSVSAIITRNKKDFRSSKILVLSPAEWLAI
ncbi:MAG: PIN domain-containing protein [Prevotellaceae bacterium]|jgi:predicted nucleic acid-binding protein|nr:PIN domain-containing protein [Prevotellaceae bacterium]